MLEYFGVRWPRFQIICAFFSEEKDQDTLRSKVLVFSPIEFVETLNKPKFISIVFSLNKDILTSVIYTFFKFINFSFWFACITYQLSNLKFCSLFGA